MTKIRKRAISLLVMPGLLCSLLSGCLDAREVDDQTYAVAIGFDKGKVNPLRLTLQYAIPKAISGSGSSEGGGGGGGENQSIGMTTVEAPTIYSGMNMMNNYIGKQINISHAKAIVFSKEIAESDKLMEYIHAIMREREFRPNMYVAVSRESAENYLKSVKPVKESNPAKYYELKFTAYRYTGFAADTQLSRFYFDMESASREAVATLVGVSSYKDMNEIDYNRSTYMAKGRARPNMGDYKAGDTPKVGDVESEMMGLAVFRDSKMAGELDGEEATMYLMATGDYVQSFMTFPDPDYADSYIVLRVKQSRPPQYNITYSEGKPKIAMRIRLEGDYASIQSGADYEGRAGTDQFEKSAEAFLKEEMLRFLNRTTQELHSDICGFGSHARWRYLTWKDWEKAQWLKNYPVSQFDVDIDLKVRRTGLMTRTIWPNSTEGE